jgi:hypothetical protein
MTNDHANESLAFVPSPLLQRQVHGDYGSSVADPGTSAPPDAAPGASAAAPHAAHPEDHHSADHSYVASDLSSAIESAAP